MLSSIYLAPAILFIAVLVLFAALLVVVRGAGGISLLRSDLLVLATQVEQLDTRITREVKTRSGLARAADAAEGKSIAEEAASILAAETNVQPFPARPKRNRRSF